MRIRWIILSFILEAITRFTSFHFCMTTELYRLKFLSLKLWLRLSRDLLMLLIRSGTLKGLVMKSPAPYSLASSTFCGVPWAVITMTSISGSFFLICCRTSIPERPGIARSRATRSILSFWIDWSASPHLRPYKPGKWIWGSFSTIPWRQVHHPRPVWISFVPSLAL